MMVIFSDEHLNGDQPHRVRHSSKESWMSFVCIKGLYHRDLVRWFAKVMYACVEPASDFGSGMSPSMLGASLVAKLRSLTFVLCETVLIRTGRPIFTGSFVV